MRHRHALYLSEAMTQKLEAAAEVQRVSKSAILECSLQHYLSGQNDGPQSSMHNLQHEATARSLRRLERDLAIATELTATFVRYFLTITPPLPESEHEAARALGQLRFEQVIETIAARLRTDRSLMARVMATIACNQQKTNADSEPTDDSDAPTTTDTVSGRSRTDHGDG
jgi:hypothetical protein